MRRLSLLVGLAALIAPAALAQTSPATALNCGTSGGDGATANGHIAWPVGAPIWEFDFYRPGNVTAGSGTGVEIRDVYYRGRKVFERAAVPIINVEYDAGAGCGCFRDWQSSEAGFAAPVRAGGSSSACYADATAGAVVTNCTADGAAGPVPDQGSFRGVSVEDYGGQELVLTSNMSAGWYRYRMKWHFYADGRIWPEYSFAAASNACTASARRHHVYWRFDFDLENTPNNDVVTETNAAGVTTTFATEASRTWAADRTRQWSVTDGTTGAGYRIEPSEADLETPVDAFSGTDALVLRYRAGEIDDTNSGCAFNFAPWLNGESVAGSDVVFWYRTSTTRPTGQSRCEIGGPTLRPVGSFATIADGAPASVASAIEVQAAVPNPFTPQTSVRFRVAAAQDVRVYLYDALGRRVRTLFEGPLEADVYETVEVVGADLPSGTYVVRVEGATAAGSTRVVLSR